MPLWTRCPRVEPGRLWLPDAVLRQLDEEASRMAPLETGGVLLGWGVDHDDVAVADLVGPGPKATHSRSRFEPDTHWQRLRIAEAYARSGRIHRYLGDWHSHPGGSATPSRRDRRTAHKISRHRAARARRPVMLIVNGAERSWTPNAYRLQRGELTAMTVARY
jgi:integrative and conjugative element protein (TIGR02256 family)